MEEKKYLDLLAKRDIQPTAIRILVLRTMMQAGRSVSLLDLETMLDTVDKSTIFRTLPRTLYRWILRLCGEQERVIMELLDIKSTGCTIELFNRIARQANYQIIDRRNVCNARNGRKAGEGCRYNVASGCLECGMLRR